MLIDGSTGFKYLKYDYDSLLSDIVDKFPDVDKQGLKNDFITLLTDDNYDTVELPVFSSQGLDDFRSDIRIGIYKLPFIDFGFFSITSEISPVNTLFGYNGDVSTINNVAVPSSSPNINIIGSTGFKYLKYDYDSLLSDIVDNFSDVDKQGLKNDFITLLTDDNYDTVELPLFSSQGLDEYRSNIRIGIYKLPFIDFGFFSITSEISPVNTLFGYNGDVSTVNNVATPALFRTPTVIYVDLVDTIDSTTGLPEDPYYTFFSDAEGTTPYPDQINGVPDLNVKKRYLFKRTINNKAAHPFFISDKSDRTAPSDQLIIESSKNVNDGILNDESIHLTFSPDFSVISQSLYFFCTVQTHEAMNKQFVLHDTDRLMIRTRQDGKVETLIPYSNKVAGYQLESTAPIRFNTQQFISGSITIEQAGQDSAGSLSSDFQQGDDKPLRLVSENNILIGVEIESGSNLVGQFHGTTLVDDNGGKPWKTLFTTTNGASGFPLKETTKVSNEFGELIDNLAIQNL